jgi:excisionase family DNA binding protein
MFDFMQKTDSYPDGLEVWQVAIILNLEQATVRKMIRARKLPAYKIGRAYLINKYDLKRFIESKSTKANSSEGCDSSGV